MERGFVWGTHVLVVPTRKEQMEQIDVLFQVEKQLLQSLQSTLLSVEKDLRQLLLGQVL